MNRFFQIFCLYFDLNYERALDPEAGARRKTWVKTSFFSFLDQVFLYAGVFLGVLISNAGFLKLGQQEQPMGLVASLIVALLVTPSAYEGVASGNSGALLKRFAFFVSQGMTWRSVLSFLS